MNIYKNLIRDIKMYFTENYNNFINENELFTYEKEVHSLIYPL